MNAGCVRSGDYSRHTLVVTAGNAFGEVPQSAVVDLPEEKRRQIAYDLVIAEDAGDGSREANLRARADVARRHGVEPDVVWKIAVEAARRGWPMPPAPKR